MKKVFILEDNPEVVLDYEIILEQMEIGICAVSDSISKAKTLLKKVTPDIAILDIYVKDSLGFELIDYFNQQNIPVLLVTGFSKENFVTMAHDFSVSSFLTKPISHHSLKFSILKAIRELEANSIESFLFLKSRNTILKILHNDILYIQAEGNNCIIQTKDKKHVIKESLKRLLLELPKDKFFKIYRSIVININSIESIDLIENKLTIADETLPISRNYKSDLVNSLSQNHVLLKHNMAK